MTIDAISPTRNDAQRPAEGRPISGGRLLQLDGMRGYAALAVVFWHAILLTDSERGHRLLAQKLLNLSGYEFWHKLALTLVSGDVAVSVFFVMSGAVLFRALMNDTRPLPTALGSFVVRRLFRIFPVLFVAIAFGVAIGHLAGIHFSPDQIWQNAVLNEFAVIGAAWTLNVEIFAIPLIALAFAGYRRIGGWAIVLVALIVTIILKAPVFKEYLIIAKGWTIYFALGMLIPTRAGQKAAAIAPAWSWIVALLLAIFAKHATPEGTPSMLTLERTACAALVLLAYHDNAGALGRYLRRPTSVFLGSISYCLYLLNVPLLYFLKPSTSGWPVEMGIAAGLVIALLTIPLAYLVHICVELPAIRLSYRLTSRKVATTAPQY